MGLDGGGINEIGGRNLEGLDAAVVIDVGVHRNHLENVIARLRVVDDQVLIVRLAVAEEVEVGGPRIGAAGFVVGQAQVDVSHDRGGSARCGHGRFVPSHDDGQSSRSLGDGDIPSRHVDPFLDCGVRQITPIPTVGIDMNSVGVRPSESLVRVRCGVAIASQGRSHEEGSQELGVVAESRIVVDEGSHHCGDVGGGHRGPACFNPVTRWVGIAGDDDPALCMAGIPASGGEELGLDATVGSRPSRRGDGRVSQGVVARSRFVGLSVSDRQDILGGGGNCDGPH